MQWQKNIQLIDAAIIQKSVTPKQFLYRESVV